MSIKNNVYVPEKETKLYVYNVAKDPKELSFTKNDTYKPVLQEGSKDMKNNMTWKHMTVKEKIQTITTLNNQIPDIEFSSKDKEILRKLELEHEKNIQNIAMKSASSPIIKAQNRKHVYPKTKPEEKSNIKLLVKSKQSVNSKIIFYFLYMVFVLI